MSAQYFKAPQVSNSDLKRLLDLISGNASEQVDDGLQEIFDFGHLVENCILARHLVDFNHKDIEKAERMAATFRKDKLCSDLLGMPDFRSQHEWYRSSIHGLPARCMCDGDSKRLSLIFELKGLNIDSEAGFKRAVDKFHYDQGLAWYLDVTGYRRTLIVGVSKKKDILFKQLVDRSHPWYISGEIKIARAVQEWNKWFVQETQDML